MIDLIFKIGIVVGFLGALIIFMALTLMVFTK